MIFFSKNLISPMVILIFFLDTFLYNLNLEFEYNEEFISFKRKVCQCSNWRMYQNIDRRKNCFCMRRKYQMQRKSFPKEDQKNEGSSLYQEKI